ncbi:MAG: TFIIB-type zinc ribbon-containing protein [Lachnospiraceae bacterium]|nr:TFIIB-type zinc ribbon-containing protein [Lachnospiraceae bacterium]
MSDAKIIDTAAANADGQTKCPKCGATDISLNAATGELRCNFCRHTFKAEALDEMKDGVGDLSGEQVGSGAADIDKNADSTVTLKCTSCGAEVVVDLNESSQARCHWCRNMLSINSKVPNGMVPDTILPFKMKKDEAQRRIEEYVGSRKFFANKRFRSEFTTDNIMGVYFPYMLVDLKGHAEFAGEGEIEKGHYTRGHDDDKETVYKVDRYKVQRGCDVEIDDLAVESSARRAGASQERETNNIINAILPFDTENCVKYDSNYLKGFTSEKRDVNKGDLQNIVDSQEREAIKFALNDHVTEYDRGVRWEKTDVKKEGEKWMAAYLPVWLYSYVENPGSKGQLTHYVAVNARTSETIGSVPINKSRIGLVSAGIGLLVFLVLFLFIFGSEDASGIAYSLIGGLVVGGLYFSAVFAKYRNTGARHHFETETKIKIKNVTKKDEFVKKFETTDGSMSGANNLAVAVEKLKK